MENSEIQSYTANEIAFEKIWQKNATNFVLKSDHDLAIRKLKRENEILRKQRNWQICAYYSEMFSEEKANNMTIEQCEVLDAEILKAIGEVL